MHLVVDTNVLFSYFKKDSASNKFILSNYFILHSPDYAKLELKKHKNEIKERYSLTEEQFFDLFLELDAYIHFYNKKEYCVHYKYFLDFEDKEDIDFLALSHYLNLPLWSNDKLLKTQSVVNVLSTGDIFDFLDIID